MFVAVVVVTASRSSLCYIRIHSTFQTREPLAGAVLAGACRRGVRSELNVPHVMKFETMLRL
jgi:hypothetical protein